MDDIPSQCASLQQDISQLLRLTAKEATLRAKHDTTAIQTSLNKAISPTFEIVFAGAFSAGKSMLINALLGRKLLYSAEGHATGTECRIAYAESDQEKVVLTFLSEAEIIEQAKAIGSRLQLQFQGDLLEAAARQNLRHLCLTIIEEEGGEHRSEKAKQANALRLLLAGYESNHEQILADQNATYSMEHFNFSNLQEAAGYARRGANSAVLKRIDYFCHHELLQDGNVFIDTPGIDAPVRKDAELTYRKIQSPDTAAVVCVLKTAETGELTAEETELLETIRQNPSIRDRVFYVFNRIDKTWYNAQLRQRLDRCIAGQFRDSSRVYRTSGLLGFYGRLLQSTSALDRFGLDTLFAEEVQGVDGREEAPLFVTEFNNYCGTSGKLVGSTLKPELRGYESPNQNYVRILGDYGQTLVHQLIEDSGIEFFSGSVVYYLTHEKRPQLFGDLADDLHPLCTSIRDTYISRWHTLEQQPQTIEALKTQNLKQLASDLKQVGDKFDQAIQEEVNRTVASNLNDDFERDFLKLKAQMVTRLDELLHTFSVDAIYQQAQASHRRNSVVPLLGILAEAFYYLANGLEDVLVSSSQTLVERFFLRLSEAIRETAYYRDIYRLLGNDAGIEDRLLQVQQQVCQALVNEARTECDRYVRERPEFYMEGTHSIWQMRQTLQQACKGYDYQSMIDSEPAIRQLLKLDFEQKVKETVMRTYRQTVNQTLNVHLLEMAQEQVETILQQYDHARDYLARTLEREAAEKIEQNKRDKQTLAQDIETYNQAISSINTCLETLVLDRKRLPLIADADLVAPPILEESELPNGKPAPQDAATSDMSAM
jgi:replication fork clamp-binding protein CrfC